MIPIDHSFRVLSIAAIIVLLAGCASARGDTAGTRGCNPSIDAKFLANGPVFAACQVDEPARPASPARVPISMDGTGERSGCSSAEVEFVVDTDGNPRLDHIRTVRATSALLASRVREAVPMMRYTPARKDGRPVPQVVRFRVASQTVTVMVPAGSGRPAPPRMPSNC